MGGAPLSQEEFLMDSALSAIYGGPGESMSGPGAGKGPSSPYISKWLGHIVLQKLVDFLHDFSDKKPGGFLGFLRNLILEHQ